MGPTLTVAKAGTGVGAVGSNSAGIACGATCRVTYPPLADTAVTLTASPAAGSVFAGWSGACTGTGTCTVAMTAARSVTAAFQPRGSGLYSDLDGDGKADLAGLTGTGQIFYSTDRATWTNIPGQFAQLVVGDVNGDGRADLAGRTGAGQIFYSTNLATWNLVKGQLAVLTGN